MNLKIVELDPAPTYRSLDDVLLGLVNITYLIAAGGDQISALIIDQTIDEGLVLRFAARAGKKDAPSPYSLHQGLKVPGSEAFY